MEIMQVNMPEKKQTNLLGTAQTGLGWYGAGKAAGPTLGKGVAWGKNLLSGSGSSEGMTAAGPIAVGTAGMALGMQSRGDVIKKGESAGNYKYDSPSGPDIKAPTYSYDTISRRMDSPREQLNPKEILDARKSVKDLPLSEPDKINIGKQLSQMLNFIKIK
jgi:hypothetical protein